MAALDPEQQQAARALEGPVVVLAGAGTGKTRAMTHRIAYGVATGAFAPTELLALTFTTKAAGEMRSRLRALGVGTVPARTFHSAALRQLRYFWPRAVGGGAPEPVAHKAALTAEAARRVGIGVDKATIRDLSAEIEWAKVNLIPPEEYARLAAGRPEIPGVPAGEVTRLLNSYEEVKGERNVIDFEDILLILCGILEQHPDIAAEVRRQYRHFVVDEFQDVSPLQHRLLRNWLGERENLCVVGDASQTIYTFAGADPRYLLGFTTTYPNATEVRLIRDYRSTPQIVELANRILQLGPPEGRLELVSGRAGGPKPVFREFPDDIAEADALAEEIAARIAAGRPARDFAVLYRTNGQSQVIEEALSARGVPFVVQGGERFFSREEVRAALTTLRAAARTIPAGDSLSAQVKDLLSSHGWTSTPPERGGAVRSRWESLQAIVALAEQLETAAGELPASLASLVTELEDRAEHQNAPTVAGVTLASLHAAKGLEWPSVYLIGLSEGLLPITYAKTDETIAEERRLFYVGVTRAETSLQLSWALARAPGARARRSPSRFITQLRARAEQVQAPGPGRVRRKRRETRLRFTRCRICERPLHERTAQQLGRCEDCPPRYDETVFDALVAWRQQTSLQEQIPAFMVLTNTTLTAVAELLPGSKEELGLVPGIGPAKLERYGDGVLSVLRQNATAPRGAAGR
nr:ATP-dependent DNA helicase UvrD2 [Sediminivirga luteola]